MATKTLEAERLQIIADRRQALNRFAEADAQRKLVIHSEYIQPLNQRLLAINKELGK